MDNFGSGSLIESFLAKIRMLPDYFGQREARLFWAKRGEDTLKLAAFASLAREKPGFSNRRNQYVR
jgi:hypothetical protein